MQPRPVETMTKAEIRDEIYEISKTSDRILEIRNRQNHDKFRRKNALDLIAIRDRLRLLGARL